MNEILVNMYSQDIYRSLTGCQALWKKDDNNEYSNKTIFHVTICQKIPKISHVFIH